MRDCKTILKEIQVETAVKFILFWQCRQVTKTRKAYGRKKIYKRHKSSKYPKYTLKNSKHFMQRSSSVNKQSIYDMCFPFLFLLWESQQSCISHSINKHFWAPTPSCTVLGTEDTAEKTWSLHSSKKDAYSSGPLK